VKPKSGKRLGNQTKREALVHIDWMGVFLQTAGIVLLLVGITLGGNYPWGSAKVLSTLIIGIVCLVVYGLWEWKGAKNPFLAHALFRGKSRTFVLFLVVDFVAGMGKILLINLSELSNMRQVSTPLQRSGLNLSAAFGVDLQWKWDG
jgi:Fungal trichothecene efflux pump (TRI12)